MTSRISGTQFVWLLLAGRLSNCLLLPADSLHALTIPDLVVVTILNAAVLLLLIIPTLAVSRKHERALGGHLVVGAYLPISLFVLYLDLLQFRDFAEQTAKADFSVTLLTVALIVAGVAAAVYGLEALGRTAAVVTITGIALLLLFGALLIPETKLLNFPPAVFSGWQTVFGQTVKELPRTAEIIALGVLYPHINGKVGKSFSVFVGLTAALTLFVCIVTTGVLGDFAGMTAYPFYTAVSTAGIGVLERLDLLVVMLWLGTFFIRVALFSFVFLDCACRWFGNKARFSAAGVAVGILVIATMLTRTVGFGGQWQIITYVYWGVLAFCSLGLPLYRRMRV